MLKTKTLKRFRFVLKILLALFLICVLSVAGLIGFLMVTEYKPGDREEVPRRARLTSLAKGSSDSLTSSRTFTCLTWNIGYAGLGKELDFFYDGGTVVNPPRERSEQYLDGIRQTLSGFGSADFVFLQEVDFQSSRSFRKDQCAVLAHSLPSHEAVTALNYSCRFIPVPVTDPMGKVESGLVTFSRAEAQEATRHAYRANFSWPKRLVFLKRCFLVTRFMLENGKQLVMVNLHNSTFDAGGHLRLAEQEQLQEFLLAEYRDAHYVVVGGDWNMNPKGFIPDSIRTADRGQAILPPIGEAFLPGWTFAFDPDVPSNRNVDEPYRKGSTGTTVIDFFILSPNVRLCRVKTMDLGFSCSDHNPVLLTFELR